MVKQFYCYDAVSKKPIMSYMAEVARPELTPLTGRLTIHVEYSGSIPILESRVEKVGGIWTVVE